MNSNERTQAESALALAITKAGGPTQLAKELGISTAAVSQWTVCPPARVLAVAKASGVTRHDLRPDMYPDGARVVRRQVDELEGGEA